MKKSYFIIALLAVCLMTQVCLATTYLQVLTKDQIQGTGGSRACYATIIEGTTAYNILSLTGDPKNTSDSGRITVTADVGTATPVTTELLSTSAWSAASGGVTSMTGFYGAAISGDYIQFSDTGTDAIWRVHKTTGAVTPYVSKAQIETQLGIAIGSTSLLASRGIGPDEEHYVYEGTSDSFIRTTGTGTVQTYISKVELEILTGTGNSAQISGGITFDGSGRMIFGNGGSDSIYAWDDSAAAGNEGSLLLSTSDITAVTGMAGAGGFMDIFYAPDGKVYFYEMTADGILSFDPTDPVNSLAFVLTSAELVAGPDGNYSVSQFTWYNGGIAWTPNSPSATSA